jgi:GNAT superfamily N-acetyltransferase
LRAAVRVGKLRTMSRLVLDDNAASLEVRTATPDDLDGLTALLTAAFEQDPIWRWAFPDNGLERLWRLLIGSALRYPNVWVAGDYAAAAVWIPPGGVELTEAEEEQLEPLLESVIGARAADVIELMERFDSSHPHDQPHYYLSLLGTDPARRGEGIGMALLRHNLAQIDAEGMPAYLESTNPANNSRYQGVGFSPRGSFSTPDDQHSVTTMWREPRSRED